jgi:hypothetical protein
VIETLMGFASSGWVRRRDLAFLLLGCALRVDVGIDPYGGETTRGGVP